MRNLIAIFAGALIFVGITYADHAYVEVASVHDIMEVVQEPSMDGLAAMMKAGGPQSEGDWKHARGYASVLGESTQLLLMGARVKDDVWTKGAKMVIAGAQEATAAAKAQDLAAWKAGVGAMGKGCRTCHKPHKPKKKQ